jgi:hypothetical protein
MLWEKMSCVNQITTRSGDVVDNEECTSFRPELRRFGPMAPRLIGFQDTDEGKPQIVIGPVLRGAGYAFDAWSLEKGFRRRYTYRHEDAHYARKFEIKRRHEGPPQ